MYEDIHSRTCSPLQRLHLWADVYSWDAGVWAVWAVPTEHGRMSQSWCAVSDTSSQAAKHLLIQILIGSSPVKSSSRTSRVSSRFLAMQFDQMSHCLLQYESQVTHHSTITVQSQQAMWISVDAYWLMSCHWLIMFIDLIWYIVAVAQRRIGHSWRPEGNRDPEPGSLLLSGCGKNVCVICVTVSVTLSLWISRLYAFLKQHSKTGKSAKLLQGQGQGQGGQGAKVSNFKSYSLTMCKPQWSPESIVLSSEVWSEILNLKFEQVWSLNFQLEYVCSKLVWLSHSACLHKCWLNHATARAWQYTRSTGHTACSTASLSGYWWWHWPWPWPGPWPLCASAAAAWASP